MKRRLGRRRRRAFTLVELLISITIIAMVALVVMPSFHDDERLRVMAASAILASDIEYAQTMCIAYPSQPVIVKFDAVDPKYWLAYAADPDWPITRPDTGESYIVEFGVGRARSAEGVTFSLLDMPANVLEFDAQGAVRDLTSAPQIILGRGSEYITISIATTTGTITETDGQP